MATYSAYDQSTSPGGSNRNNFGGTLGIRFHVSAFTYLTAISFYCPDDAGTKPGCALRNASTHAALFLDYRPAVWAGAAPGWFTRSLTSGEIGAVGLLDPAVEYELDLSPANGGATFRQGCPAWDDTTHFTGRSDYYGDVTDTYANTPASTPTWGISLTTDDTGAPPPSSGGPPAATGDLQSYFSSDTALNTHQGDLPWLTRAGVATANAALGTLGDAADATGSVFARLKQIGLDVATILSRVPSTIGSTVSDIWTLLSADLANILHNDPVSGTEATGNALTDLYNRLTSTGDVTNAALAAQMEACCDWLAGKVLNAELLTLVDTWTLNGQGIQTTDAQVHHLHVTTVPDNQGRTDIGGSLWLPRFGWWAPITASGNLLERRYIDWQDQWLWPIPAAANGIAYWLPNGCDAVLTGYVPTAGI